MAHREVRLGRYIDRAPLLVAVCLLGACAGAVPARAQFASIAPSYGKLTGGYMWGSIGYRDVRHPERFDPRDPHPFVRGGFAVMFGPFGGQSDTVVTLDSIRTSVEWMAGKPSTPGAMRTDTLRTVHALRSRYTLPGRDGWVSIALGYEYAAAYRIDLGGKAGTLASTFPVGGLYGNAMLGPFPFRFAAHRTFWYATLGAGIAQLTNANGRSDSTLVRFDTERALAAEGSLLLGWRAHRGVRVLGGLAIQRIRWSSIRYRSPSELPLPDPVMQRLPSGLRLTSIHFSLGVSFDASDLFGK